MAQGSNRGKQIDKSLNLDNQLCFAMYAAARAITKTYMETLRDAKLTYPQYLVLVVLLEHEQLKVSEIGSKLHLDSGTLTPVIKRLETDGIVTRRRSTADEREVYVSLTPKGRSLRKVAAQARALVVQRLDMTNSGIAHLRKELMDITCRLGENN